MKPLTPLVLPAALMLAGAAFAADSNASAVRTAAEADQPGGMVRELTHADRQARDALYKRSGFSVRLSRWLQPDSLQSVGVDGTITMTRLSPRLYRVRILLEPEAPLAQPNPFGRNLNALMMVTACLFDGVARANGWTHHNFGHPRDDEDQAFGDDITFHVGYMNVPNDNPPDVGQPLAWTQMDKSQRSAVRDMPERMRLCDLMLLPGAERQALASAAK